ncbi:MAG: ergosterol biosynthesis protein [Deltaproteobacteria bacterium]|nr:ergosterol biosynthesis protein [Nannocystaceae bacterium]
MNIDAIGFFAPWLIYAAVLVLHLLLPAQRVRGYVCDAAGVPLAYRLNGLPVLLVVLGLWWFAGSYELIARSWLWEHRWAALAGAVTLGLVFTFAIVLPAAPRRGWLADLYLGRLENPRVLGGRLDLKMFLYQVGATMLALNLASFAAHHVLRFGDAASPGVLLHVALFGFFLLDYLFFERVHLYTYDLFAERVGFKLGWGCLAFYPYFYAAPLWSTADRPDPGTPTWLLASYTAIFFAGWMLARGANLQKFFFKLDRRHRFLGVLAPETVADDHHALLCNGFWGVSRHVNYLGELLMASGLALVLGWPGAIGPWLYPIYYLVLLVPRERDDHRRCAAKYGALWDRYCAKVRWRIVPGIY